MRELKYRARLGALPAAPAQRTRQAGGSPASASYDGVLPLGDEQLSCEAGMPQPADQKAEKEGTHCPPPPDRSPNLKETQGFGGSHQHG